MASFTLVIGNKNYSSWSLRAWLVLKKADVDFEEIRISLYTPTSRSQLLQYSPSGKVPVLRHGSLIVWDSLAICEYIADLFPDRYLLPQTAKLRAIVRSVSAEMHSGFLAVRQHLSMNCRARMPKQELLPEVQSEVDRILTIWHTCRQEFGTDGDFLFGRYFTIADAMYAPVVSRFITYGIKLDPIAQAYADTIWSLPAMQEWLLAAEAETEVIEWN